MDSLNTTKSELDLKKQFAKINSQLAWFFNEEHRLAWKNVVSFNELNKQLSSFFNKKNLSWKEIISVDELNAQLKVILKAEYGLDWGDKKILYAHRVKNITELNQQLTKLENKLINIEGSAQLFDGFNKQLRTIFSNLITYNWEYVSSFEELNSQLQSIFIAQFGLTWQPIHTFPELNDQLRKYFKDKLSTDWMEIKVQLPKAKNLYELALELSELKNQLKVSEGLTNDKLKDLEGFNERLIAFDGQIQRLKSLEVHKIKLLQELDAPKLKCLEELDVEKLKALEKLDGQVDELKYKQASNVDKLDALNALSFEQSKMLDSLKEKIEGLEKVVSDFLK